MTAVAGVHQGTDGVFVLGLQRSGTTWVANMLASSGAVAAITAEDHRGVHESIFFSHFAEAFRPFSDPAARAAFREAFVKSDYFLLSGLEADVLDAAIAEASDHADVFAAVMTQVAQNRGAQRWLEKSPHHTRLADALASRYKQARFVCVTRDSATLIQSRLAAYGRTPKRGPSRWADIVRGAMSNALATRRMQDFASRCDRALLLTYRDFLQNGPRARAALVRFLEIDVAPDALVSAFAPNTSHDRGAATRGLGAMDRIALGLGNAMGAFLPLGILIRLEERRRQQRGVDWPDWVWRRSGWTPPQSGKPEPKP